MYRIKLVNMPFGALRLPSIALTQLKSVVEQRFGDAVSVELCYLNHDFGAYLGLELYGFIANSSEANTSGLGDWFFRDAAFPHLADNTEDYFRRYYPQRSGFGHRIREAVLAKRPGVDELLTSLIEKYLVYDADLVGFTSMFAQNMASFAMARKLKHLVPELIVVMGGANCEPPMGQQIVDHVPQIDFAFGGPALKGFPQFVEYCLSYDLAAASGIPGVTKARGPLALREPGSGMGEEVGINEKVALDYESFLTSLQATFPNGEVEPSLLFETSRGCWWGEKAHCTFCGLNGLTMNYRDMEASRAVELFADLFRQGEQVWLFEAVDNIMPKDYPKQVFPHLTPPENATIFYEVKADISEEDIRQMSRARVQLIQPGIESLASSTLKLMRKGSTAFQNAALLKHCVQYDVGPVWNLLIGFPGEQANVYQKYLTDLPRMTHLPPPSGVFPVRFDRFSPYFNLAGQYGLDLHPLDFYELIYPMPQSALRQLAYYFADHNISAPYLVAAAMWIGRLRGLIEQWRRRWSEVEPGAFPRLCFIEDAESTRVLDFRTSSPTRWDIGPAGRDTLKALAGGLGPASLARKLPAMADGLLSDTLADLERLGLLFREGDRVMSLVHDREPAIPDTIYRMLRPPEWAAWLAQEVKPAASARRVGVPDRKVPVESMGN